MFDPVVFDNHFLTKNYWIDASRSWTASASGHVLGEPCRRFRGGLCWTGTSWWPQTSMVEGKRLQVKKIRWARGWFHFRSGCVQLTFAAFLCHGGSSAEGAGAHVERGHVRQEARRRPRTWFSTNFWIILELCKMQNVSVYTPLFTPSPCYQPWDEK